MLIKYAAAALIFVAAPAALTAPPKKTVAPRPVPPISGSLTVDGKKIALRYAYAIEVDDVEGAGLLLSGPRRFYVLVLSDKPLPRASISNRMSPQSEQKSIAQAFDPDAKSPAQGVYAVALRIDAANKQPFSASFLFPKKESLGITIMGGYIPDKVTGLKIEKGMISGTAQLATPHELGEENGPKKYQYSATFRIPLTTETAVTKVWEGKDALDSPPVQAMRAYMVAAQKGDIATVSTLTMTSHQAYLKKPEVVEMLKQGDVSKMAEQVRRVVTRGDEAAVVIVTETPSNSQVTIRMGRENGAWKMYWP